MTSRKVWWFRNGLWGTWVAQSVKHLPLAQVLIPGSWDRAPNLVLCSVESLLLPLLLPAAPPTCAFSVSIN